MSRLCQVFVSIPSTSIRCGRDTTTSTAVVTQLREECERIAVDVDGMSTLHDIVEDLYPGIMSGRENSPSSLFRGMHGGRSLKWYEPVLAQVRDRRHFCIDIVPCLNGGGGDGGSTGAEDRAAYLAMYAGKKHDKVDPAEQKLAQYTTCRLSGEPLRPPCVCDELGGLYNKDALLSGLLSKSIPKGLPHITSRKVVFDVTLFPVDGGQFGCPVTELPLNGKYKFVVVMREDGDSGQRRGYVVSRKAIREMPVAVEESIGGTWNEKTGVLSLYPEGEELDAMLDIVMEKHQKSVRKKARKTKRADGDVGKVVKMSKRGSSIVPAPEGADPTVWASLFVSKENDADGTKSNDYMTRGVRKYI